MVPKNKRSSGSELIAMSPGHSQDLGYQRPFMDVRELLSSLWREKIYVIAALAAAMAIVGLYLLVTPKSYTATAQILIDLNRPLTGEGQSFGADTTRFMMGPVIDSQVEIIRASRIIRRVIERTGYQGASEATTEEANAQATDGTRPAAGEIPLASVGKFQENLDVRRKGLTSSCLSSSPTEIRSSRQVPRIPSWRNILPTAAAPNKPPRSEPSIRFAPAYFKQERMSPAVKRGFRN